jgi:DNA (cytosine-5)-methyltransferase 1
MKKKEIKVIELFAGVGGFKLGLEGWEGKSATSKYLEPIENIFYFW